MIFLRLVDRFVCSGTAFAPSPKKGLSEWSSGSGTRSWESVKIAIGSSSVSKLSNVNPLYFLPFFLGVGIASSAVAELTENKVRATELTAGSVFSARLLGVLSGVGNIPFPRMAATGRGISLFFILSVRCGVCNPRDAAAEAVVSKFNAPETLLPPISDGLFAKRFFVAVCGEVGRFEVEVELRFADFGDEGIARILRPGVAGGELLFARARSEILEDFRGL